MRFDTIKSWPKKLILEAEAGTTYTAADYGWLP